MNWRGFAVRDARQNNVGRLSWRFSPFRCHSSTPVSTICCSCTIYFFRKRKPTALIESEYHVKMCLAIAQFLISKGLEPSDVQWHSSKHFASISMRIGSAIFREPIRERRIIPMKPMSRIEIPTKLIAVSHPTAIRHRILETTQSQLATKF